VVGLIRTEKNLFAFYLVPTDFLWRHGFSSDLARALRTA